ncbi:MAG: carboxypeptidase regulatory-like domain-containing protein [FCB group bacterium]|nr:carboxypeptidase regulatory-like domain-containing protein [FCB group bacterium]
MLKNPKWPNILLILTILIFTGCSNDDNGSGTDPALTGHRPEIETVSSSQTTIKRLGTVTVSCTATDAENDPLLYDWSSNGGTFPSGSKKSVVIWKAPDSEGLYTLTVWVSNGSGSTTEVINITVTGSPLAEVHGYVYRAQDSPISGANVCYGSTCVSTNSSGYYVIHGDLPIGNTSVTVSASGYQTYNTTKTLVSGDNVFDYYLTVIPPAGE